jgi:hypothetical protein
MLSNKEKFLLLVGVNTRSSKWVEESKIRKENRILIKQSQEIAIIILLYLEENNISKEEFSKLSDISLKNLSIILKGQGKYILSNEEIDIISNLTKQDLSIYSNKE